MRSSDVGFHDSPVRQPTSHVVHALECAMICIFAVWYGGGSYCCNTGLERRFHANDGCVASVFRQDAKAKTVDQDCT